MTDIDKLKYLIVLGSEETGHWDEALLNYIAEEQDTILTALRLYQDLKPRLDLVTKCRADRDAAFEAHKAEWDSRTEKGFLIVANSLPTFQPMVSACAALIEAEKALVDFVIGAVNG